MSYPTSHVRLDDYGSTDLLFETMRGMTLEERESFSAVFLGTVAARVSAAAWQEALIAAISINREYMNARKTTKVAE